MKKKTIVSVAAAAVLILWTILIAADQRILYTEQLVGAGHPTKGDTLNRLALVGHNTDGTHKNLDTGSGDADGDIYYRASSALARLGIGAANQKLFTNAGGTAPTWAAGFHIGTITRDLTAGAGSVAYTGVGFKPGLVIFSATLGGADGSLSIGFDDGTSHVCQLLFNVGITGAYGNYSVIAIDSSSNDQHAAITSMDSDGFTLAWAKTGSPTGTAVVYYVAFR